VPDRVWEAILHGVRSGATNTLAAVQLHDGGQLSESLSLDFIAESNDEGFEKLMVEFAPCADAVAHFLSADDIIACVFDDED